MKVILLGYSGFIGSYILKELAKHLKKNVKLNLICVGRNTISQPFQNKKIKYIKWDFVDFTKSKLFFLKKENIIINCVGKNYSNKKNLKKINLIFIKKLTSYIKNNKILVRLIQLSSVSVYGAEKKYVTKIKTITENFQTTPDDLYSKSKLDAELCIQNISKINKKHFSFTILRIANVFSELKNPNSFKLINFLLNKCVWFKCSAQTNYHYIHAKDIASVVLLCILHLKKSRNKIYNVSDDINQLQLHKIYAMKHKVKLLIIPISLGILKLIIKYIPLPKIIFNFFLTISSQITYNNYKIKKELNFHSRYSLRNKF
jgi:nucleoside-diphosphate-sugar epimerase